MDTLLNVARRLSLMAQARPEAIAVVEPLGYDARGKRLYRHVTFSELDRDSDRMARGLRGLGVLPGTRLVLLVRPGIDFIALVFGLFKAGAVAILIDPGMGRRHLLRCLAEAEPEGFVAISLVHAVRTLLPNRFPKARFNVTVGRRWFWGGVTLGQLRGGPRSGAELAPTTADQPAAIIFTTGSTGPPKGVLYSHGNFDAQVDQIRDFYGIRPGEIDLPAFPLFGLFNCAMGVTAVIPDMDPSRPGPGRSDQDRRSGGRLERYASVRLAGHLGPRRPLLRSQRRSAADGSPRASAGAPVPAEVLRRMKACIHPEGDVHTPYGATEALPVASISASEVLGTRPDINSALPLGEGQGVRAAETTPERDVPISPAALTPALSQVERGLRQTSQVERGLLQLGAGVCVGRTFSGVQWKVIRIVDGPIRRSTRPKSCPPARSAS